MYNLIYLIGFIIRQFLLPNPFTPLGKNAELINLIVGVVFVPLSYGIVGLFYKRGSAPAFGSILFTVVYAINTGITYLVCLAYPIMWLMFLISIVYIAVVIFLSVKLRKI